MNPHARSASTTRKTAETEVSVDVLLDGEGRSRIDTGIGFLDHLLTALARHARLDLELRCRGDLEVDDHHTAEDTALALGGALSDALGDKRGIARFGHAFAPLDDALARAVVDLSGRPFPRLDLGIRREMLGGLSGENVAHVLSSLATAGRFNLHVDVLRGENDHHRAEAAFKATALALRTAVARANASDRAVPSTKEVLE